jgi:hypothetical protein
MGHEQTLEASPLVGVAAAKTAEALALDNMLPSTKAFLLEKGVIDTNFCARCASLCKPECVCIATDKVASLLAGALGPSTLGICLAFNCTDGSFKNVGRVVRVSFKGVHSTYAWQMAKFADAFDSMLGLSPTGRRSSFHLSLSVVMRPSRVHHSLRLPVDVRGKDTNLTCVVAKLPMSLPESSFDEMSRVAINLQNGICERGVAGVCESDQLTREGKAALLKMAAKDPKETERRASDSLVSTSASTCRKSNLWVLLEMFGLGHSKTTDAIFNTALWRELVQALGPEYRAFACSFLLTWLSCDGSVGASRVTFHVDVQLTDVFMELIEVAAPGVAATCSIHDQLNKGCHKTVRNLHFSRRECLVTLSRALLEEADTDLLLAPLGGECGYTPTTPDRMAALRVLAKGSKENDFGKKVSLRPLAVTLHLLVATSPKLTATCNPPPRTKREPMKQLASMNFVAMMENSGSPPPPPLPPLSLPPSLPLPLPCSPL